MPSPKNSTTLREVMQSYLPEAENPDAKTPAAVRFMRNLARQIRDANQDILDTPFDADKVHEVGRGIFDYIMGDFARAMDQAEAQAKAKGREVTEADLLKLTKDSTAQELAKDARARVYEAVTSSTTDSI